MFSSLERQLVGIGLRQVVAEEFLHLDMAVDKLLAKELVLAATDV